METTDALSFNKDYYAVISNEFIMAKQETTLQCARLIRFVIANIILYDKDLKTYTCKISELADFLGIARTNMYQDIDTLTNQLLSSYVQIRSKTNPNKWDKFQLVSRASSDGHGKISIRLSEEIKPYVLALSNKYTQYQLRNILEFSSLYSIRLYEILKSESNRLGSEKVELSVTHLREILNCEKKYDVFRDFKRRVIEAAVMDINAYTDICVEVEYLKREKVRGIAAILFCVRNNHDPQNENSIISQVIRNKEARGEKIPPTNYTVRLFEYLNDVFDEDTITVNLTLGELRTILGCDNKYSAFKDFKRKIIEPTVKELNEKTNLCIDVQYTKTKGIRGVSGVSLFLAVQSDASLLDCFVPDFTNLR